MRKLLSAIAIGVLASSFVVSTTAIGKGPKSPKQAPGIALGGGHPEHARRRRRDDDRDRQPDVELRLP